MQANRTTTAALDPSGPITPQIYAHLRDAIIRNTFAPGDRISESEIARSWTVSRQPVREAFIKLQEIGLVEILPQRGTFVVKISARDVENARFIREAVEVAIARKACELASESDVAQLQRLIDDPQTAERLAQAGRTTFEQGFTEDVAVRRYLDLFDRLLAARPAAAAS